MQVFTPCVVNIDKDSVLIEIWIATIHQLISFRVQIHTGNSKRTIDCEVFKYLCFLIVITQDIIH